MKILKEFKTEKNRRLRMETKNFNTKKQIF